MSVKQTIKVTNAGLSPILSVAQGTGAIEYEFTVSDFDIPSGSAAVAYNIQPTGNIVSQTCSISGNTITVKPPAYYFLRGKNYMQFQVSKSNEDLFSFLIEVWCAPNISQPEVIVAENPSLVSQLISDVGLLSAQLDNLLSIPSGSLSTSSDAALADIKIGYDGTTYDTPGDAVRGQISLLSEDISNQKEEKIYAADYGIEPNTDERMDVLINNMISENWDKTGACFVFIEGKYRVEGTITFGFHHQIKPVGEVIFSDYNESESFTLKIGCCDDDKITSQQFLRPFIDNSNGYVVLINKTESTKTGIDVNARKTDGTGRSNIILTGLMIDGYNIGIDMRPYNSYIWYIDGCQLFNNRTAVQIGNTTGRDNSGEKCTVSNCIFSGNDNSIRLRVGGYELRAINCSFDFEGIVILDYMNNNIYIDNCHIEGAGTRRSLAAYKGIYDTTWSKDVSPYTLTKLFVSNSVLFLQDTLTPLETDIYFISGKNACIHLHDICIHNHQYSQIIYGNLIKAFYLVGDVYSCNYDNIDWAYNSSGQAVIINGVGYPNFDSDDTSINMLSSETSDIKNWNITKRENLKSFYVSKNSVNGYVLGIIPNDNMTGAFELTSKRKYNVLSKNMTGHIEILNYPKASVSIVMIADFYDSTDTKIKSIVLATTSRGDIDGLNQLTDALNSTVWLPNMYNIIADVPQNAIYYKIRLSGTLNSADFDKVVAVTNAIAYNL